MQLDVVCTLGSANTPRTILYVVLKLTDIEVDSDIERLPHRLPTAVEGLDGLN